MRPPHRLKIANLENHIGDFFFSAFSHPQSLLYSVSTYFFRRGRTLSHFLIFPSRSFISLDFLLCVDEADFKDGHGGK